MEHTRKILDEIEAERRLQASEGTSPDSRAQLVKLAAWIVTAIEQIDSAAAEPADFPWDPYDPKLTGE